MDADLFVFSPARSGLCRAQTLAHRRHPAWFSSYPFLFYSCRHRHPLPQRPASGEVLGRDGRANGETYYPGRHKNVYRINSIMQANLQRCRLIDLMLLRRAELNARENFQEGPFFACRIFEWSDGGDDLVNTGVVHGI